MREQKNFLSMLSHEFKAPLSIIKANADAATAIENPPPLFIKESLERIQHTSFRLTDLVDGCLNDEWVSHVIEKNELSMTALNLVEMLNDLCVEYGVRFAGIRTSYTTEIQGDRYLMSILFSSLIDNARKHACHRENVEVRAFRFAGVMAVEVFDDGPGIAEQERERIFDKYYRVQGETRKPGSGLGLFFVKRIVEQHGGTIKVTCRQGTTFMVTLPAPGEG